MSYMYIYTCRYNQRLKEAGRIGVKKGLGNGAVLATIFFLIYSLYAVVFWWAALCTVPDCVFGITCTVYNKKFILSFPIAWNVHFNFKKFKLITYWLLHFLNFCSVVIIRPVLCMYNASKYANVWIMYHLAWQASYSWYPWSNRNCYSIVLLMGCRPWNVKLWPYVDLFLAVLYIPKMPTEHSSLVLAKD